MRPEGALFHVGPIGVSAAVVTTWGLLLLLALLSFLGTRRLRLRDPGALQLALEGTVMAIEGAVAQVVPERPERLVPFVGTLWIFLAAANLTGVVPGLSSPTSDLSTASALALLTFLSVHWFGVRADGLRAYLRHYVQPSPVLLPFHILSELTRTAAMAVRLFGNMVSLEMAALLVVLVAGLLVPVPILLLHILEALVQAYIFGTLALIYIGGGIQTQELRRARQKEREDAS